MDLSGIPLDIAKNQRPCATCFKHNVLTSQKFKNCTDCREKNRQKKVVADERKKERERRASQALERLRRDVMPSDDEDENVRGFPMEGVVQGGASSKEGAIATEKELGKRKETKALSEMEGEERDAAIQEMKKRLKKKIKANGSAKVPDLSGREKEDGTEHQTASMLYDAIKSKSARYSTLNKRLRFRGCHSIVTVSSINHDKRIDIVENDLRKLARLSFANGRTTTGGRDAETGHLLTRTVSFSCTCTGPSTVSAPSAPADPPVKKGTQGDLIRWARARAAFNAPPAHCGGTVSITVRDDNSHPYGIPGQQIIVNVKHPK